MTLRDAQETTKARRVDYNEVRPHSGLADRTPNAYARELALRPSWT